MVLACRINAQIEEVPCLSESCGDTATDVGGKVILFEREARMPNWPLNMDVV
jgi:hypothetical protein